MARMWPHELPDHVLRESRRSAEIKVYRKLQSTLDDSWSVFYSRPWLGLDRRGAEVEGEADFIVAHPEHGLLFIEVKGGGIAFDPARDRWTSTDRYGASRKIKDPVNQAISCKHRYLDRLKAMADWPRGYIRFRHGVVFPDSTGLSLNEPGIAGYDEDVFCFAPGFEVDFGGWVRSRLSSHGASHPEVGPGAEGLACLRKLVADPVTLRVSMRSAIESEIEEMDALLTGAQLNVLIDLNSLPRAVVEGGAGTGKTVLACELAARASQAGKSVLVLCASEPLSRHLGGRLGSWPTVEAMTLGTFRGKRTLPTGDPSSLRTWDVVIVDEGQDVPAGVWTSIEAAVSSGGQGPYVFMDSNQAVYVLSDDVAARLDAPTLHLRLNLRNTQRIAAVTESLYRGPLVVAQGPVGEEPVVLMSTSQGMLDMVAAEVDALLRDEALSKSMIAILVNDEEEVPMVADRLRRQGIASRTASQLSNAVVVESVRRFKGLEAPVIVIAATRPLAADVEMAYVAVSRARSHLIVVGPIQKTNLGDALAP